VTSEGDAELVARLCAREPAAFDELYRTYRERIWKFLHRLSGSVTAAEDLFQDTWLAAARNAHQLRRDTRLLPWLFTIARNKHRNSLRFVAFERKKHGAVASEPRDGAMTPDEQTDSRLRADRLSRALARLPDAHREVLLLHFGEGLDSGEVAEVLDVSEQVVRKRLSRARAELARLMGSPPGDAR
jgi:RNA polymerase sigma-70 factor (ECF subfamily)